MEPQVCPHCKATFTSRFCPQCGQEYLAKSTSTQLVWRFIGENLDLGKKFFRTWYYLFVLPDKVISGVLNRDITRFVTPIKYFLSVLGLIVLVDLIPEIAEVFGLDLKLFGEPIGVWKVLGKLLYLLPWMILMNKLILRSFTWTEHLFIALFLCSQLAFMFYVMFITTVILALTLKVNYPGITIIVLILLVTGYTIWFNIRVFQKKKLPTILKTVLILLLTFLGVVLMIAYGKADQNKRGQAMNGPIDNSFILHNET